MNIKIIIVDDASPARNLLRMMITELADDFCIVGEAANAAQAMTLIQDKRPFAAFMDINMPDKSGIDFVAELRENYPKQCEIIFATAYNDYAIKALRLDAVDYLPKPIDESELLQALNRLRQKFNEKQAEAKPIDPVLSLPVINGYEYIRLNDVEYLKADGSYVHIYLSNGSTKIIAKNLKYFEAALDEYDNFIRVHRAYIVNIKHIISFSKEAGGIVYMRGGGSINVARSKKSEFQQIIKNQLGF